MAWVDDRIWCHGKFLPLSDKAFRVWVHSLGYAGGFATKGHLDLQQQRIIGSTPKVRAELISGGLWDENGDGKSIVVHDWDEHNGKRDERREKDRERKRNARAKAPDG